MFPKSKGKPNSLCNGPGQDQCIMTTQNASQSAVTCIFLSVLGLKLEIWTNSNQLEWALDQLHWGFMLIWVVNLLWANEMFLAQMSYIPRGQTYLSFGKAHYTNL